MIHRPLFLSLRAALARPLAGLLTALLLGSPAALATDSAKGDHAPVESLDEQVQEIKSDVLSIAAELGNLEEKLLYPSDTQLALFVSLAKGETLELDSARISLDGQLVAHHIYSFKELEALAKGGVQRIHTANVMSGSHRLEVEIAGRRGGGQAFDVAESFDFSKEVGPKRIGIRLAGAATTGATVAIEAW